MFKQKKKKYRYKILLIILVTYITYFGFTFNTRYNEYIAQKEYCKSLDLKYSNQTIMNTQSDEFYNMVKDIADCTVFKSLNKFFPISLLF